MLRRSIVSEAIGGLLSPVVSGVVLLCSFRCSSVSAAGISPLAFLTASLSRPWETHSHRFSSSSNCATTPGRSGLRNRLTAPGAVPLSAVRRFARAASAPRRSSWQKRITTGRDLPLLPPSHSIPCPEPTVREAGLAVRQSMADGIQVSFRLGCFHDRIQGLRLLLQNLRVQCRGLPLRAG